MPGPSEKQASAAAMDALDLDELFREGDDAPLFADMDIEMGDMGDIFDAPSSGGAAAPSGAYNQRAGGDVLTREFGITNTASTRGKRVRTAKTNPHLLAAAEREGEPAQKRRSAIEKELQKLHDSNESAMLGDSKRKRRRSKKVTLTQDEDAEKVGSKKKRRSSSKIITNAQQIDLPQSQQPQLQHQQQALQQIFHQMNPEQQQRLQERAEAMGLNIFAAQSQTQGNSLNQQDKIIYCGLQPSTTFYPYCALPSELDIKRGQKIFPVLEKINSTSVSSSQQQRTDSNQDGGQTITTSSPLYTLFHQHLGLIPDSDRGIFDLIEAVKLTNTSLNEEGGRKKMAVELSKLLSQCLRQSGFIKQNLSNLESWVKGEGGQGWSKAEILSVFPGQKSAAGSSGAASGAGATKTDASSASKRGTTASAHVGPTIAVAVKVRLPGWRDKSGTKLTARLPCPPGWKVAMSREKQKAEAKKASSENVPSPVSATTSKSAASRKRKAKESTSSATTTAKAAVVATRAASSKVAVPFISSKQDDPTMLHTLYTKILRPSTSPAQRRELLANEISSTVSRLENARLTQQWTKARKLQDQMKALQSVYKDDMDIVPDMCNTIGMWRMFEHSNYFKEIEDEAEVCQEFADCVHEEEEIFESKSSLEQGTFWGSGLSEKRRVSSATTLATMDDEEVEPSPLFDRLQSLLVEVDGSDDDDEDDDEDLIRSLPKFSADQFVNGPNGDSDAKNMIDVSKLTLDQRTYIQLRAIGLIDANTSPSSFLNRAKTLPSTSDAKESIDSVLKGMKMHLSKLQSGSNDISALQHKALLHAKQASERKQKERDEEAILAKYKQLQKTRNEQENERKRTSSR